MLLVLGLALAASVAVSAQVLSGRADDLTTDALSHEVDTLRAFVRSPAAREAQNVEQLLTTYLQSTVPDDAETMFTLVDGKPHRRVTDSPPVRLDRDRAFLAKVRDAKTRPRSGWWDTSAGPVRYGVIPLSVQGDTQRGSVVIVQFRDAKSGPLTEALQVVAFIAAGALVLAALASWSVAGRVLAPVRLVRQTAQDITETDLHGRIEVTGRDDVAQLALTFNSMLDRLEESFVTQRRFIDDTTHELRTPITVIRGHLELLADEPERLAETTDLSLDELDRMRRIVDDLSLLARAERPDFLVSGHVDVADLTVDALDKAQVLGDRRWRLDEVAEGEVSADGQRLTQAVMQLISNAVRHTEPGDTITLGSRREAGRVRWWVSDTGPGVAEDDRPYIFERFRRGGDSTRRDGSGLGLAIVETIARAHGGHARLVDQPSGARFEIEIPDHQQEPS